MNPACRSFLPLLSPYVDGELAPKDRTGLERHLSVCKECTGRVADFRAQSALVRVGLDMRADEVDFKDFAQKVMARITPERPPLLERLKVGVAELFTYRKGAFAGGFAMAMLVVAVSLGFMLKDQGPAGYAAPQVAVDAVSTDEEAHVAPVVMKTEQGTIIWLVDHADKPGLVAAPDSGRPQAAPGDAVQGAPAERPKGGEL